MKIHYTILVTALIAFLAGVRQLPALRGQSQKACSANTLRGEYLFQGRGDAPGYRQAAASPMVFAGVRTFDGRGKVSQIETISLGGAIQRMREEGTYTVDAECNGTMTIAGNRTFDMFLSRHGNEGVAIRTTDGSIGTQTFKKRGNPAD